MGDKARNGTLQHKATMKLVANKPCDVLPSKAFRVRKNSSIIGGIKSPRGPMKGRDINGVAMGMMLFLFYGTSMQIS